MSRDARHELPPPVAIVALDAMEWPLVESMLADGDLPVLAHMNARGTVCRLHNESLYRTSLVWNSFLTDEPHPDMSHAGGMAFNPATYASYKMGARALPTFLDDLDGLIALDVPYLSNAGRRDDAQVFITESSHIEWLPRGLSTNGALDDIDHLFGADPTRDVDEHAWHSVRGISRLVTALEASCDRRVQVAERLVQRSPDWRLLFTAFDETHAAAECLAYSLDPEHPLYSIRAAPAARAGLARVYRAVDRALGALTARLPDNTTVVAFALHGLRAGAPDLASSVLLPEFLSRWQLGEARLRGHDISKWARAGYPPVVPRRRESWVQYMRSRWEPSVTGGRSRLRPALARLRGRRRSSIPMTAGVGPDGAIRWPIRLPVVSWYRDRWPEMRSFALPSFADGRVRINVEGREARGVVPMAEYRVTCDEVEERLRDCRNPRTGESVVDEIVRPRIDNPMASEGPDADLVIRWAACVDAFAHPELETVGPFPFLRTAEHTPHGFVLFSGQGVPLRNLGMCPAAHLPSMLSKLAWRGPSVLATAGSPA
jgi:hypothetical protein